MNKKEDKLEITKTENKLKKIFVFVCDTIHLRPSSLKLLLLLLCLLLFLEERDAGSFVVDRPIGAVVHVRVVEIRKFRLEGLRKQNITTNTLV